MTNPLEDDAPPTAHWRHDGGPSVLPVLRDSVVSFAADRGMAEPAQAALVRALDEVLAGVDGAPVRIDASTDGAWLAIRIEHTGPASPDGALPVLVARVQVDPAADGAGRSVLFELPMR